MSWNSQEWHVEPIFDNLWDQRIVKRPKKQDASPPKKREIKDIFLAKDRRPLNTVLKYYWFPNILCKFMSTFWSKVRSDWLSNQQIWIKTLDSWIKTYPITINDRNMNKLCIKTKHFQYKFSKYEFSWNIEDLPKLV